MRIGLNATCFNDRPSGANQRFFSIYDRVVRQNPDIEFLIYEAADYPAAARFEGEANVVARRTPLPSVGRIERALKGACFWPLALRSDGLDLLETFSLPLIMGAPCPTLLTVHDLRPIQQPTPWLWRQVAGLVLRDGFARADHVIAVSETVRQDILACRRGTPVSTVYNGIDADLFASPSAETLAQIRARYALPGDFMLTVGHIEPRKNFGLLVDAVALLRDRGLRRPLVIVGRDGGELGALQAHIARRKLGDVVTIIEDAQDDSVRALYAQCRQVVIPSRYEGFGIPILEAMAARRPLLLSDIGVFRELTEGRGAYFPLDDPHEASRIIERVWNDPEERARLIAYGAARVADFDFDRPARQIGALYRSLLASRDRTRAIRSRPAEKEWKRS